MTEAPDGLLEALLAKVGSLESAVVAFSGGVDSSLVAALAVRSLGTRALAVTAVSPALATGELAGARRVASALGIAHEIVETHELARPGYRANGADRCYHCKSELFECLGQLAAARGFAALLSGTNADDLGDWRPGLSAAGEHGVVQPLVELGAGKRDVRALAAALEVPSAAKPASPCLASRVPHGTAVDAQTLARIDGAELGVRALGFSELRVRHLGDEARVEIGEGELERALAPQIRAAIVEAVVAAGYRACAVSERPLVSGSLTVQFLGRLTR